MSASTWFLALVALVAAFVLAVVLPAVQGMAPAACALGC